MIGVTVRVSLHSHKSSHFVVFLVVNIHILVISCYIFRVDDSSALTTHFTMLPSSS